MEDHIRTLLSKKSWTGDEVGRAIILSLIDAYKQTSQGAAAPKGLFTAAQLTTMVRSLRDKEQGTRYHRYIGLNNWISQNNAIAVSYYEQVRGELNRLLTILSTARAIEDEAMYMEQLPLIMTQKQYDEIQADPNRLEGNKRALFNGIAIFKPSDELNRNPYIDERGHYTEWDHETNLSLICGLEQFSPRNRDYAHNTALLKATRKTILDGYYFLLGYDAAVDLIAEYIGLPEFSIFRIGKEVLAERINALDDLALRLHEQVKETDYRDKDAKKTKLQIVADYFAPLALNALALPEKNIAQAKALLNENMRAFEVQDGVFLRILTKREEVRP